MQIALGDFKCSIIEFSQILYILNKTVLASYLCLSLLQNNIINENPFCVTTVIGSISGSEKKTTQKQTKKKNNKKTVYGRWSVDIFILFYWNILYRNCYSHKKFP